MILRNISARSIALRDTLNNSYSVPAYSDLTVSDTLWSDNEFRRWLRMRIRDVAIITTTLVAGAAPDNATYVTLSAAAGLSAEFILGTTVIMKGTLAARPAFGNAGVLYYVTDSGTQRWTRDNGAAWEDVTAHYSQLIGVPTTFPINVTKAAVSIGTRAKLNFIQGLRTTLTVADNGGTSAVDVTVDANDQFPASPATGDLPIWSGAAWVKTTAQKITYAMLNLTGLIVNADIASSAAIAVSKLNIPSLVTQWVRGDGTWSYLGLQGANTSTITVNTTVAETTLLGATFTVPANSLGTNRVAKLIAYGDWLNNSGSTQSLPRFKFKFGGTAYVDTGVLAAALPTSATRGTWRIDAEVANAGATGAQTIDFRLTLVAASATAANQVATTGSGYTTSTAQGYCSSLIISAGTKDTTVGQAVDLTAILPASNASLEIRCAESHLEIG